MLKRIFLLVIANTFFMTFVGCSTLHPTTQAPSPTSTTSIAPADCYFVCDHKGATGIAIYTPNNKSNMVFENSYIEHIIRADGTFVYPNGTFMQLDGQIPSDCLLFITNNDTYEVGVWDVDEGNWLVEPAGTFMTYHKSFYGQMLDFTIDGTMYNLNIEPIISSELDTFELSDGTILKNIYFGETSSIADESGNIVLDANTIWQQNQSFNIVPETPHSIELKHIVAGKYLVIAYYYSSIQEDNSTMGSSRTYLCDLAGNIYFPQWNYQYADYPQDQYNNTMYDLFCFINYDSNETHYMDLRTQRAVEFPNEYDAGLAKTSNLFLLSKDSQHTIYNLATQEKGATFSSILPTEKIYVWGVNSYSVGNVLVIDGQQYKIGATSDFSMKSSPYPVINVVTPSGNISKSYILDSDGKLVVETTEYVTYADSSYYCVYDANNTESVVNIYTYGQ